MPFDSFGLHPALLRGIEDIGFTIPTDIQEEAIPPALAGKDLLASARTGSGKTAAFLLPLLHRLMDGPRGITRALVLTPTRELAAQIDEQYAALAYHTPVNGAAIYGGVPMNPQSRALESGVELVVATPGRLLDHLRHPYTKLGAVEVLVLDEADRMLDMGFLPDVRRILRHLPGHRQTLFFSATLPPPVVALTRDLLRSPVRINVGGKPAPAVGVTHTLFPVAEDLKGELLLKLLEGDGIDRALTFTRTRTRADRLASFLSKRGVPVALIHGDRSQTERTDALARFKSGAIRVLVATDVAARGIDIEDLSHVINYDVPGEPEDYVHRVGRTARAECTGDAFTFVSPAEEADVRAIERAIGRELPRFPTSTIVRGSGRTSWLTRAEGPRGRAATASPARRRRNPRGDRPARSRGGRER